MNCLRSTQCLVIFYKHINQLNKTKGHENNARRVKKSATTTIEGQQLLQNSFYKLQENLFKVSCRANRHKLKKLLLEQPEIFKKLKGCQTRKKV